MGPVTGCPAHTAHMATLRELTRWSDPALSGLVAGCGLAFLLSLSLYSAVSVVAYTMLALAMVGLCCKMYVHLMGLLKKPCQDPLARVQQLQLTVTEDQVQGGLSSLLTGLNATLARLRSLVLVEDYLESAKFGLTLYTATFLGALVNTLALLTMLWVAAFTLPPVYSARQAEIDSALEVAAAQYAKLSAQLSSLLPAHTVDQGKAE